MLTFAEVFARDTRRSIIDQPFQQTAQFLNFALAKLCFDYAFEHGGVGWPHALAQGASRFGSAGDLPSTVLIVPGSRDKPSSFEAVKKPRDVGLSEKQALLKVFRPQPVRIALAAELQQHVVPCQRGKAGSL